MLLVKPFTVEQQKYWIKRCVVDYPENTQNSLLAHYEVPEETKLWEIRSNKTPTYLRKDYYLEHDNRIPYTGEELFHKLRWITLGYRYNWLEKQYLHSKSEFPEDLKTFGREIGKVLGIKNFESQAAFINYYHFGGKFLRFYFLFI